MKTVEAQAVLIYLLWQPFLSVFYTYRFTLYSRSSQIIFQIAAKIVSAKVEKRYL